MAQNDKPPNTMGDIKNNRGIITQGQTGNNTIINPIQRDADGICQGDKKVGSAPPPVVDAKGEIASFQAVGFTAFPDPTQPLEYADLILQCDGVPQPRPNMFAATISIAIVGFRCKIIGRR
jgi:hypothetical protein